MLAPSLMRAVALVNSQPGYRRWSGKHGKEGPIIIGLLCHYYDDGPFQWGFGVPMRNGLERHLASVMMDYKVVDGSSCWREFKVAGSL